MKSESYKQFATVRSDDTNTFDDELNRKMRDLRWNRPEVQFREQGQNLIAHISYYEREMIPEDLGDVYEMIDVSFKCEDCPMFKPIRNKDGSPNLRVKYGDCPYSEYGRTYKNARACDMLYKMLRSGEVRLCLAESES